MLGAEELLREVRGQAKVAIVTNNLHDEQRDKLEALGLDWYVDALVASEEVGVAKPDPGIFRAALERVGCSAEEAVMVGDSWESEVAGARASGVRAVWLNRRGVHSPEADIAAEIRGLGPVEEMIRLLGDRGYRSSSEVTPRSP